MTNIKRNTKVVSVSLSPKVASLLDGLVSKSNQTKSSLIESLIKREALSKSWDSVFEKGEKVGRKFNIQSEADVYRFLAE